MDRLGCRLKAFATRDLPQQPKKALLPTAGDAPIHGDTLVAVVEGFVFHAEVEEAPRNVDRKSVV